MMNEIYVNYWKPLQNFFLPTFKLKEKIRVGAKIKKIYDTPKTPVNRLLDSKYLTKIKKGLTRYLCNLFTNEPIFIQQML
jgi:hypothetical protein